MLTPRYRDLVENDGNSKQAEDAINGLSERGQAIVKGLQAVGQIHPFVGGKFFS